MSKIAKKTWPELFQKILVGEKTFDARIADFACSLGDILIFKEWDPKTKQYTGRIIEKKITYIFKTKEASFWQKDELERYGLQIMAFK
jgi:hypothetical protein